MPAAGGGRTLTPKNADFIKNNIILVKPGKINSAILRLAIPNIVTNITVPLLGLVDLALMGHLKDPVYIGAIALGSIIFNVVYSSFSFLRMGTSGMTSQAWGAKNKHEVSVILARSFLVAIALALALLILQKPIQWLSFIILDGSPEVTSLARQYFYIRIWAAPATLGLYTFYGWYLGTQNAWIPMTIAIVINVINIGLNFLFVMGFGMTSEGVALSTVIAQYSGLITALIFLLRKYRSYIRKFALSTIIESKEIVRFFKINTDIFIRTVLLLLTLAFFTNVSAGISDEILAVNTLLFQFFFIFSYFADGFAYAGEALAGKAYGEKNISLLNLTNSKLFIWGWSIAILTSIAYYVGLNPFMKILTSNNDLLIAAREYYIWVILIPLTSIAAFIWDGIYVGVTKSKGMRNAMIVSSVFVFLPAYYLTKGLWGNHSLWMALNLFMAARGIMMWVLWRKSSVQ